MHFIIKLYIILLKKHTKLTQIVYVFFLSLSYRINKKFKSKPYNFEIKKTNSIILKGKNE